MSTDSDVLPTRQPSGRRSKPSMDLLVDNQRILTNYVEPKKRKKIQVKPKPEIKPVDNDSLSSMSSITSDKPDTTKNNDEDLLKSETVSRTLFVSLEIDKELQMKRTKVSESDSDDNIPLAKMYPDIVSTNTLETPVATQIQNNLNTSQNNSPVKRKLVLTPKKKLKNYYNLNGSSEKSKTIKKSTNEIDKTQNKLFEIPAVPTKINVLSLPKIPKKKHLLNGSSDSSTDVSIKAQVENIAPAENKNIEKSQLQVLESPDTKIESSNDTYKVQLKCIRDSCHNPAIDNFQWDNEFCSADCAVKYSQYVFEQWLILHKSNNSKLKSSAINNSASVIPLDYI